MLQTARRQRTRWVILPADSQAQILAAKLNVRPLVAQVLINRGYRDLASAKGFLQPRLTDLSRPEHIPSLMDAAGRIMAAIRDGRRITVYGDYDVDGIAGVVILVSLLSRLGACVDYYIPHRIEEGYGLNDDAIRALAQAGTALLITVDCGIGAAGTIDLARQLGMEVIVTDHHALPDELPKADVVVHPAMFGNGPVDHAGAAVAMKLAWAVANVASHGGRLDTDLRELMLDATCLAALGTICDLVDLRGENRILAHYGLRAIAQSRLPGLCAIVKAAGLAAKGLDSYDVGFIIGPMLNAAGRMGHARLAVELLLGRNPQTCHQIAEYLKAQNTLRQSYCQEIFHQACQMIKQEGLDRPEQRTIVVYGPDWHIGLLGIVASRIVDHFGRPAIVLGKQADGSIQGSGRSIPGFCLLSGLKACSQHLGRFGGHSMAAGLTLNHTDPQAFAQDLEAYARGMMAQQDLGPKITIEAVAPLGEFSIGLVRQLDMLAPFGQGNSRPVFASRGVRWLAPPRRVGARQDHLQLAVADQTGAARAIGFNMGHLEKRLLEVDFFDIAFQARLNTYNGNTSVELVLEDILLD
ncbi:MAG: single-stranded-DNA-specific exonuclease RecJ [Sedimentisphaerales bacterium]|jgi:single-stranded-DNA-specific exonuclease|nr:single-stranded-DNA-specific exonuclease RecJ [Sedimentisphaerales bacterium]